MDRRHCEALAEKLGGNFGSRQRTVLIVDPEATTCHRLAGELGSRGFDVWAAETCETALHILARARPEMVFLELKLPDGCGMDLLRLLSLRLPHIKSVVLTSYGSIASAVQAIQCGATNYLAKPATAEQVLQAVAAAQRCRCATAAIPRFDPPDDVPHLTLQRAMWEYVHQVIASVGSIGAAARSLGVDRRNLRRFLAKYPPPEQASPLKSTPFRVGAAGG